MAKWFLPNPGFELGDQDWGVSGANPEASIVNDAGNARTGAWAMKFVGNDISRSILLPEVSVRPGSKIDVSIWIKDGTTGFGRVRAFWKDAAGATVTTQAGPQISPSASYAQSSMSITAPDLAKSVGLGVVFVTDGGVLQGTWYADDMEASGQIIEDLPASAEIQSSRLITADTIGVFDPLIGDDKFTDFNSGMSDKWAGVYEFVPRQAGEDLSELLAFIRRIGRTERFFAFDPDHTTPINGIVNGMTVNGAVSGGATRIPVTGGPVSSTALVDGDYVEIGSQYFQLQRDLKIGPEGTGDMIVWPAVRSTLADGEDVITGDPKMVARITSDLDWSHPIDTYARISISWQEV